MGKERKAFRASDEDLATAVKDEHGVLYSKDGSSLLKCENKELTEYAVKEGTKVICDSAFSYCDELTSITLPAHVEAIGDDAFHSCRALKEVKMSEDLRELGEYVFADCRCLEQMVLPKGVTRINDYTFWDCDSLESVVFNGELTLVDEGVFCGCEKLKRIVLTAAEPPKCYDDFYEVDVDACELHIPAGSQEAYASAEGWNKFKKIGLIG